MREAFSIRGATTVEVNSAEAIREASVELFRTLTRRNGYEYSDIVNIFISTTQDLTAAYPAAAIRADGVDGAPLFSCAEPSIDGALAQCIRVIVTVKAADGFCPKHVYLRGAKCLRPDLAEGNDDEDRD